LRSFKESGIDAYRQGFKESSSTGAAHPGSPPAAHFRKSSGFYWDLDGDRVAYLQDTRIQAGISKRAVGGFLSSLARLQQASGAAVTALLKVMVDQTTPSASRVRAADRVLDHAAKATTIENIEARIGELERTMDRSDEGPEQV
jgi:hypothetical protein